MCIYLLIRAIYKSQVAVCKLRLHLGLHHVYMYTAIMASPALCTHTYTLADSYTSDWRLGSAGLATPSSHSKIRSRSKPSSTLMTSLVGSNRRGIHEWFLVAAAAAIYKPVLMVGLRRAERGSESTTGR